MPFTLAHPAAALPLKRPLGRYGSSTALAIGSMAPDFIYFLPLSFPREHTHSWEGLFYFCLPVSFPLYLLFRLWLREPLIDLLPKSLLTRLPPPDAVHSHAGREILRAPISLMAGAATHLLWDGLTHRTGLLSAYWTAIPRTSFSVAGFELPLERLLQHGSSLLGLVVLALWSFLWFRSHQGRSSGRVHALDRTSRIGARIFILFVPSSTAALWSYFRAPQLMTFLAWRNSLSEAAVAAIASGGVCLILFGIYWHWKWKKPRK